MGIFAFSNRLAGTPSSFCLSACFYAIPNFEVAATFHLLPVKKIKKTNQKKKKQKNKKQGRGLWKILHGRLEAAGLFPGLTPVRCVLLPLCVKAAEPGRHREDSAAGGRSHAVPPGRGPATGSLIDSSNTPHILLPFIKASPSPPPPPPRLKKA